MYGYVDGLLCYKKNKNKKNYMWLRLRGNFAYIIEAQFVRGRLDMLVLSKSDRSSDQKLWKGNMSYILQTKGVFISSGYEWYTINREISVPSWLHDYED